MDWGLGNPNKTAALIATIMLAVWVLAYVRKWGFWLALPLFTGFGLCLILTLSRGALVGLVSGGPFLLAWAPRPFPFSRTASLVAACIALAIFAWGINAPARYTQGLATKDPSIANRLLIWEQVPAMIYDAPNGWGIGRSGDAYMQWYQPINRSEGYRTLVNSHLTWLAELDWPGRIVYVFAWVTAFILLLPRSDQRWYSIPFGIWVAFAICAAFSSVAEAPLIWIVPVLALLSVVIARFRQKSWPEMNVWLWGSAGASAIIATMSVSAILASPPSAIHCSRAGIFTLGTTSPKIWIVAPNRNVLGEHYGHEVRRGYESSTTLHQTGLGIVTQLKNAPANETLVFSGQVPSSLAAFHPTRIILINPKPLSADELQALLVNPSIMVVVGEFSQNKEYWSKQSQVHPNIRVQLVLGSEEYIPNWMAEITNGINRRI
jgi:hypothetical protein